jgi:NifU-like protein involved in Fe-S cluster formation
MTSNEPYSGLVVRYFDEPAHVGPLSGERSHVFTGAAGRREAGLQVRFEVRIHADLIADIAFQAYGCPHTIAACSLITERLAGQTVAELHNVDMPALMRELEVPVEKTGRVLILQDALHDCFRAWENRRLAGN